MSTEETVLNWIKDHCLQGETAGVGPETQLIEGGLLDSLQVVEVVVFVENHFGISIEVEDLTHANFGTVRDIASLADRLREQQDTA